MSAAPTTTIAAYRLTKAKLDAIAEHDRRPLIVTLDVLADEYIAAHGIELPEPDSDPARASDPAHANEQPANAPDRKPAA